VGSDLAGIPILYEHPSFLVLNKPAGMAVLPEGWDADAPFLVRLLEQEYGKIWIVHRLDKVTSGVMVIARTAEAHRNLSIQFEQHRVQKIYHAIVNGVPAWERQSASQPLRVDVGHSHRTAVNNARGKPALTEFHVLERFHSYSLLEAMPATGRTHQIRVHAYALGFPLLGDTLYSARKTDLISRPALHSFSLAFLHPLTGEMVTCSASYPHDFQLALEKVRTV
jgi:tRNA pseudouridine32 synthase / 23S rRNA pseudouridine746 synthase